MLIKKRLHDGERLDRRERGVMNCIIPHYQRKYLRSLLSVELEEAHIVESHARDAVEDSRLVGAEKVVVEGRCVEKPRVLEVEKPSVCVGCRVGRDTHILGEMIEKADVEIRHGRRCGKPLDSVFQKFKCGLVGLIFTQKRGENFGKKNSHTCF